MNESSLEEEAISTRLLKTLEDMLHNRITQKKRNALDAEYSSHREEYGQK
jgi:hypothetical protein